MWKRWIVVIFCVTLIATRYVYPNVQVDTTTVWLVIIAVLAFLLPDLKAFTPYIKRVKIGDTEIELKDEIGKLSNEVDKVKEAASKKLEAKSPQALNKASKEAESILENLNKDPRATLLLLSSRIEKQLKLRLVEADINIERVFSLRELSRLATSLGILPEEFVQALDDFIAVRNRVAHGEAFDVNDNVIYSLISIGARLLEIVSVPLKGNKQKNKTASTKKRPTKRAADGGDSPA
jgi:F0F1-type ATP synthase membrane subunit b/b'